MAAYNERARYLINLADSGSPAGSLVDSTGNGNDIPIVYNGFANWILGSAGRGIQLTKTIGTSGGALMRVTALAGNIATAFNGVTEASITIKFSYGGSTLSYGNLIVLGHTGGGDGLIRVTVEGNDGIVVAFASEDETGYTLYHRMSFYVGPLGAGVHVLHVVFDSTQEVDVDRARVWLDNTEIEGSSPGIPLNAAIVTMGANHYLAVGNRVTGADTVFEGVIWYASIGTGSLTPTQISNSYTNLLANNDANPLAPPTLAFSAAPTADQITASSIRINFTANLACNSKILVTSAGSTQPSNGAFDASPWGGAAVAFVPSNNTITGLTAGTYRFWVRIYDGTTYQYQYVQDTIPAASNTILQVNGGQPLKRGQATVVLTWDAVPGSLSTVTIGGVAQVNHTQTSPTTTTIGPLATPNVMYGQTAQLVTGSVTVTTPVLLPADGYDYRTLSGYVENPPQTPDAASVGGNTSVVAVDGDQYEYNTQGGHLSMDTQGRWTFGSSFNGSAEVSLVDSADGTRSPFVFLPYGASADIIPNVPTLIANVPSANPGQSVRGSFVLAGVDAGQDIPVVGAGFMQVSTTDGSGYGPSITRQLGQTVYYEIIAGAFGEVRTGNVSMNGVTAAAPLSVTTRAANAPSITTQPSNQSVTSGAVATFSVAATNAATYQWQKDTAGNGTYANISGATSATYARTTSDADLGTSNVRCIVTSSEGASTTSASATLTVIAAATRLVIPAGVVTGRGASMAGATAVPINIRNVNGALIHSTTVTIAASGVTNIDSNQNGAIGTDRFVGFPSSVDGSEALIRLTVQAAS